MYSCLPVMEKGRCLMCNTFYRPNYLEQLHLQRTQRKAEVVVVVLKQLVIVIVTTTTITTRYRTMRQM